jgi:hypothetical protein
MEETSFLRSEAAREGDEASLELKEQGNELLENSKGVEQDVLVRVKELMAAGREKMGKILGDSVTKTRRSFEIFVMATALGGCGTATQAEINSALDQYSDKDNDNENEEENEFPLTLHINDSDLRDRIVLALQEAGHMSDEEARRSRTERLGMESGLTFVVSGGEEEVAEIVVQEMRDQDRI